MLDAILARAAAAKTKVAKTAPPSIAQPPAKKLRVGMAAEPVAPLADLAAPAKHGKASMSHEQSRFQFLVRVPAIPSTKFRYKGPNATFSKESHAKKAAMAVSYTHLTLPTICSV